MMYAVVFGTPGISVNTTLPRDAKEGCSEFDLGVAASARSALGSKIE